MYLHKNSNKIIINLFIEKRFYKIFLKKLSIESDLMCFNRYIERESFLKKTKICAVMTMLYNWPYYAFSFRHLHFQY